MKIEIGTIKKHVRTEDALPAQVYTKDGVHYLCVLDGDGFKQMAIFNDSCVGPGRFNEARTGYVHVPEAKLVV